MSTNWLALAWCFLSLSLVSLAQEAAPAIDQVEPGIEAPATNAPATNAPEVEPTAEDPAPEPASKSEATPAAEEKPAPAKTEPPSLDESPAAPSSETSPATEETVPKVPKGELPWKKPTPRLPGAMKPIDNVLQLLELRGIAKSEWERFRDGEPWGEDDRELLLKLLLQMRRIDLGQIAQWRQPVLDWWNLPAEEALAARGSIFQLEGVVRRIETKELIPELVEIYEFKRYYQLHWVPPDAAADSAVRPLSVFVRRIPADWTKDADVAYPASVDAIFLRAGSADADSAPAYFVGDRVAWHPTDAVPEAGIQAPQALLAKHGFDAGLIADLKDSDGHPFEDVDREPFYQTLFALSKLTAADWKEGAVKPLEITALLSVPADHRLELTTVRGTARRIVKVLSEQDDLKKRFGIDHYYQVDFFLPLGDQAVKLGPDTKDSKSPIYYDEFPATLCVLELPPGVQEGESVQVSLQADAAFYRVWSYRSDFVKQFNPRARQIAPMFLAKTFEIAPDGLQLTVSRTDLLVGGGVLATLIAFGVFMYFASKKPKSTEPTEKLGPIS